MIIENKDQTIFIPDDSKKLLIPYWFNKLSNIQEILNKKLSGICKTCINKKDLTNDIIELKVIGDHIFHYSITTKNDCLKNIAYDLCIVESDLNLMLLDEVIRKFSFMTYHNIEKCKACIPKS